MHYSVVAARHTNQRPVRTTAVMTPVRRAARRTESTRLPGNRRPQSWRPTVLRHCSLLDFWGPDLRGARTGWLSCSRWGSGPARRVRTSSGSRPDTQAGDTSVGPCVCVGDRLTPRRELLLLRSQEQATRPPTPPNRLRNPRWSLNGRRHRRCTCRPCDRADTPSVPGGTGPLRHSPHRAPLVHTHRRRSR